MINDIKAIKEETGLDIGKLWFQNEEIKELYDDSQEPILYDKKSGNFHMLPNANVTNINEIKKEIEEIGNKRKKIINNLDEELKKLNGSYKINKYCGIGKSKAIKQTGMINAFSYIRVEDTKDNCYDIMFSKFFVENDTVNCILCDYQFSFMKQSASYKAYPRNKEDGSTFKFNAFNEYYNPCTKYGCNTENEVKAIVKEFIEYINKHEN